MPFMLEPQRNRMTPFSGTTPLPRSVERRLEAAEAAAVEDQVRDDLTVSGQVVKVERRLRGNRRVIAAAMREEFAAYDEFVPLVGASATKQTLFAAWLNRQHTLDEEVVEWFRR